MPRPQHKDLADVVATVVDYGTFLPLAECLAETFREVNYYHPNEQEYRELQKAIVSFDIPKIKLVRDYLTPGLVEKTDLWVFPDIAFNGPQLYFRSIGKRVWGHMGMGDLELFRTRFLEEVKRVGLPVAAYHKVKGLTALSEYLKTVKRKWVKLNEWRGDAETFFHIDYEHSRPWLSERWIKWLPVAEMIVFVVQDEIPEAQEIGYDGWSIDGFFPESAYAGYEKKNQLYLGSQRNYEDLPEGVREVNRRWSPILRDYGYRNFFATELRVVDGKAFFIDPTCRMAGQTMEQLLKTCSNLAEVIYKGAAGEMVKPVWRADHAAEATLSYTAGEPQDWKIIRVPEEAAQWVKLYHHLMVDGAHWFPPGRSKELGVILGMDSSVEGSINNLRDNFSHLKDEPVSIPFEGFASLLSTIKEAEEAGMEFTEGRVPEPAIALNGD
jgi:hypothetical protein